MQEIFDRTPIEELRTRTSGSGRTETRETGRVGLPRRRRQMEVWELGPQSVIRRFEGLTGMVVLRDALTFFSSWYCLTVVSSPVNGSACH